MGTSNGIISLIDSGYQINSGGNKDNGQLEMNPPMQPGCLHAE